MSVTLLKKDQIEASFLIEIDAKTFEKALMEEYHKETAAADKPEVPTFLSNQALLGQYPGLDRIAGKALEKLLPAYYMSAIKKLELQPLTFPQIMPRMTALGEPCVVEIQVKLEPKIELTQYEGLEVTYTPVIVTEDNIAQQIKGLRKQYDAENDDEKLLKALPYTTFEELTAEIRKSFESMAEEKTNFAINDAVLEKLLEANPFEIREDIIEQQIGIEINQIRMQMGPQAMEHYMKTSGRTMGDLRKEVKPQAEATIKRNLILTAVAEKVASEVTEDDIKEAILKQPTPFMSPTLDYEARRKHMDEMPGAIDQMKHAIRMDKALKYVVGKTALTAAEPISIMDDLPPYMQ